MQWSDEEMITKRALYFEAGAREVRLCDESGSLRFYASDGECACSEFAPNFPQQLS